jgi:hypothetical protein
LPSRHLVRVIMMKIVLALAMLSGVAAECPNACSGHGSCGAYDMCDCFPKWQANDCSQKTCEFGLAHVDSPKGDLDSSASSLSGPTETVVVGSTVYPYGTTEQFPAMETAEGTTLDQTAHYYMECSNKGICDRKSGECECFDGYEGSACQRASCPNDCSGHGTCETIQELAEDEFDNIYALWDKDITLGCKCDPGYSGADCSSRLCKYGIDPLYIDDESTARVASATYIVRPFVDGKYETEGLDGAGTYAIKFYDVFGEDYKTDPILASDDTTCLEVVTALESLPNTVIPGGSVFCSDFFGNWDDLLGSYNFDTTSKNFHMYSLTFTGNPGYLKPIEIDAHLDGQRPTTYSNMSVWSDGMTGEFTDYFATQCELVYATILPDLGTLAAPNGYAKLGDLTTTEVKYLKKCLGDSDGFSSNNIDVYDWDYGSPKNSETTGAMGGTPHVIKLVKRNPNNDFDGGKYAVLWFDGTDFILATKASDFESEYAIFTTDGTAERVHLDTDTDSTWSTGDVSITATFEQFSNTLLTSHDASCETGNWTVEPCLDKGDLIFITDANWGKSTTTNFGDTDYNTAYAAGFSDTTDLYTITKIWKTEETATTAAATDQFRITVDKAINWEGESSYVQLLKFTPAASGNYEYVSMCSNRGLCDEEEGLCACFKGYTNDNCNMQSSLAV